MIASGVRRSDLSEPKFGTHFNQLMPIQSGVISKTLSPAPPPASASRNAPLSRRQRKSVSVSQQRSTVTLSKQRSPSKKPDVPAMSSYSDFGLEVNPDEILWRGWEPGEEYTKNLTLKNIHIKTQKIKYRVPTTRFFSTLFPQVIVLSAGTSFTLPLTFKPLEKEKYEDRIEFITSQGNFSIPLRALLPDTNLHLPQSLHFGLIAAHDNLEIVFEIKNMSTELVTNFSWEVPEPFTIIPPAGSIPPRGSFTLKGIFRPQSASVFETFAICCYGENNLLKKVKLEGIGKFPHLLISTTDSESSRYSNVPVLNFGCVRVHDSSIKSMTLQNLSEVRIPFKIQSFCYTPHIDKAFSCLLKEGIVLPHKNLQIPIEYNPMLVGGKCIDYFEVSAVGDCSKSVVKCEGSCQGPVVSVSPQLLNFGLVNSEKQVTKTLSICNSSKCEAVYEILLDSDSSVWHVNQTSGILKFGETQNLLVSFTPLHPINYYRRLVILVHEQGPLYIDLIGTCHREDSQPPLLKPCHLDRYKVHVSRGLSFYSPEILDNQLKEKKLKVDGNNCLMLTSDESVNQTIHAEPPMAEYFDDAHNTDITHNPPHVSLDKLEIWFGEENIEGRKREVRHETIRMTNHTRGKITAIWMQDPSGVFEIIPPTCDVPPLKTTDFRVEFRPPVPNQFFGAELECYTFYKSMRDYRLVDDTTITPPWCLTVLVSGHTCIGRSNTFLPQVELGSKEITFPATSRKESSYRTMLLRNNGTTPVLYQFLQNSTDQENHFIWKRCQGIMKSKFHISVFRLIPTNVTSYDNKVTLRLNDNKVHDEEITLLGTGEQPELFLSNRGELYFPPTCIGTVNSNEFTIQNSGRLEIAYKWKISSVDSRKISVFPNQGVIMPNEIQTQTWTFSPEESKKYLFKPVCYTWPKSEDADFDGSLSKRKFTLRVIGEGDTGEIRADSNTLDFSCVICGSASSKFLVLHNTSKCNARFKLSLTQSISSQYGENPDDREPIALQLSKYNDMLPARSRTTITVTAKPQRRVVYSWTINYELIDETDESVEPNRSILLCELSAEGVYPTLEVVDARSSGSGASIGKTQLWRWFSLNALNSFLQADPDEQELRYSVSTRHSMNRRPSVYTRSVMDCNFGAAPLDSESCFISIMLKNTGSVVAEWAFLFPKDLQLPMDYWTETGEFDVDELHELHIQDNKLFSVSPKKGKLNPGEYQTLLFQYKHDIAGTHRIPVLFKLESGREILLNFIGVTVESNRRYIHFPGDSHMLTPVPIGGPTPPKQLYEVYNGGSVAVMYEVNVSPLVELQTSNFDHPILTCLNSHGEVFPGTCANIEFIFSPLEAKKYMVDIPIHIIGGDTAIISFTGIGYDSRAIGPNMPMLDQPVEFSAVPKTQAVVVPGQHLFLSEERISFGNIPLFSRARHSLYLENKSQDRQMRFSWHASSETVNDVLRIEPVQGRLEPGEIILTKVTFCAAGQPSFYDLDLICEVVDEIKLKEYDAELQCWEEEKTRQEVEFTIVDDTAEVIEQQDSINSSKSSQKRMNLENVLNKNTKPVKLTKSVFSTKGLKSEVKHYTTLPPIRFEDPVGLPSDRSRTNRRREAMLSGALDDEWPRPQPPEPFVCHLGITARTHEISEFRTNFSHSSNKHFIDRMLQVSHPLPTKPASEQYILTTCDKEEKDTVALIMSKVIRSLLDDPTFHESIQEISNEKTPYFPQLAKEEEEGEESRETMKSMIDPSVDGEKEITFGSQSPKLMDQILKEEEEDQATPPMITKMDDESTTKAEISQESAQISSVISDKKGKIQSSKNMAELDQEIKRSPVFGSLLEDILSSTIANIMTEAAKGEVVLTARPRVVALPPSTAKQQQPKLHKDKQSSRSGSSRKSATSSSKRRKNRSLGSSTNSHSAPPATDQK